jgi:hypothetical protein
MAYNKTIVCLAKSIKHGGYCIAGKESVDDRFAGWIRPVSDREDEEIRSAECRCDDGTDPLRLDVVTIPLLEARPCAYQTENHLIDAGRPWRKLSHFHRDEVESLIDHISGPLWSNGYSSTYGLNDRVPENVATGFSHSLVLVKPTELEICVETEGAEFGNPRRRTRAAFHLNGLQYKLTVTDPIIRDLYRSSPGRHPLGNDALLCVSLGEVFEGCAYKLVAAVITPDA